ncbi:hypothetical protein ADL15_03165 [Actinoplanes awajinensis subsp. mycoplanecinus]|uniref:Uncharacterized protein n=2 Tax=Actinoplanes awajinensis TaxID=135946 RepID=A0A0X3VEE1_9ACTN|nr:hypothetical protein ADL15_03165 [Actinoplanes awajinensis subsp. mycoplanecinus]
MDAVPYVQRDDGVFVGALMPPSPLKPAGSFVVSVEGEILTIPYRIYGPELGAVDLAVLSETQRTLMHCLYTRHHDGRVRQRHLSSIIGEVHPWVAPFVVQLVGEYVLNILMDIRSGLVEVDTPGTQMHAMYGRFGAANPEFIARTRQRVASYWHCYYRNVWTDRKFYPGTTVIDSVRAAARHFQPVGRVAGPTRAAGGHPADGGVTHFPMEASRT